MMGTKMNNHKKTKNNCKNYGMIGKNNSVRNEMECGVNSATMSYFFRHARKSKIFGIAKFLAVSAFFLLIVLLVQGRKISNANFAAQFDENAADIAELFPAAYPLEAGDVVCLNEMGKAAHCREELDLNILGVVSTKPALILKGDHLVTGWENNSLEVPIALKGRVPVKVSCNASIRYGDLLTSSGKGGYAIKKDLSRLNIIERIERMEGTALGKALENCDSGEKKIMIWVD